MKSIRSAYKLCLIFIHLVIAFFVSVTALRGVRHGAVGPWQKGIIGWWMRRLGNILGLRITTSGQPGQSPMLLVSNHISWLDIPVIASVFPTSFLSKVEIRHLPIIGMLATRAGTLFIDRGGLNAANKATEQMTWHLLKGQSIAFFPEGTTTDGRFVKRFHSRLFAAAIRSETEVQPLAIRYPHIRGVHPLVPFLDDAPLFGHGWRLLGEKAITAELTFCEPLVAKPHDRRSLAEKTHAAISDIVEGASHGALSSGPQRGLNVNPSR